jgi:hypothetical protein
VCRICNPLNLDSYDRVLLREFWFYCNSKPGEPEYQRDKSTKLGELRIDTFLKERADG